jgi:transcriptional regulator with XRE-family HTH domain
MTEKTQFAEPVETLRNWLRTNRKARNIPMRTVADRLKVPHTWVAKTENGERRLDVLEFVNLCLAIGVDPHQGLDLVIAHQPSRHRSVPAPLLAAEPPPKYGSKKKASGR